MNTIIGSVILILTGGYFCRLNVLNILHNNLIVNMRTSLIHFNEEGRSLYLVFGMRVLRNDVYWQIMTILGPVLF